MKHNCSCPRCFDLRTGLDPACRVHGEAHDGSRENRKLDALVDPDDAGDLYRVEQRPDRFETE